MGRFGDFEDLGLVASWGLHFYLILIYHFADRSLSAMPGAQQR